MEFSENIMVLKHLYCKSCVTLMRPPIYICLIGHSFCSNCKDLSDYCPIMGCARGEGRNYALEALHGKLSVPCKNFIKGCRVTKPGADISGHEDECPFNDSSCPIFASGCQWIGCYINVLDHVREFHAVQGTLQEFQHERVGEIRTMTCYNMVFNAYDTLFNLICEHNPTEGYMQWMVYHLGPESESPDFYFEVQFENKNTLELHNCESCAYNVSPPFSPGSFYIRLRTEHLGNFYANGDLIYTFSIRRFYRVQQNENTVNAD